MTIPILLLRSHSARLSAAASQLASFLMQRFPLPVSLPVVSTLKHDQEEHVMQAHTSAHSVSFSIGHLAFGSLNFVSSMGFRGKVGCGIGCVSVNL